MDPTINSQRPLNLLEHCDFFFDLISSRASAATFPTREQAEAFASGIREARVKSLDDAGAGVGGPSRAVDVRLQHPAAEDLNVGD